MEKQDFEKILDAPNSRFNWWSRALILLSMVSFSVGTIQGLSAGLRLLIDVFDYVVCALFLVEYLLRVWCARSKLKFMFSFYGLIDLMAAIPFYLFVAADLRVLRLFRLLRLFKLSRHSRAMTRLVSAFNDVKGELLVCSVVALIVVFVSASGIYVFESPVQPDRFGSIFHCLWWAVVTLTTVGYGDVYPLTVGGKIFTGVVVTVGLGVVAVPSGLIASALTRQRDKIKEDD